MKNPMIGIYFNFAMQTIDKLNPEDRVILIGKILEVVCPFCGQRRQTPICPNCKTTFDRKEG